jgi:hypothetical protein
MTDPAGAVDVAALTAVLAPSLPALLQGDASRLEQAVGTPAADISRQIWDRLGPVIERASAAAAAALDLAAAPDDIDARVALEWQIKKALDADESLKADIVRISEDLLRGRIAVGDRSVAVSDDVSGVIIAGDRPARGRTGLAGEGDTDY